MRFLALILGITTVTSAAAEDLYSPARDADALTAQFVYESRFGGAPGMPAASAFKLQFANEGQRLSGFTPFQAEFRPASGEFYVNGMNVNGLLIARQEESSGISSMLGGFLPLVIVIGAAALIIVDGNDQDFGSDGTGSSGG
jgi:hypothetical protein